MDGALTRRDSAFQRGIAALHAAKRMWSCLIWTLPPETAPILANVM